MSDAKRRTDAWESQLTDEQQWALYNWSRTPVDDGSETPRRPNYDQAKAYIASLKVKVEGEGEQRKVSSPSRAAWYRFLATMRKHDALQQLCRIEAARDWGREVVGAARMDPEQLAAAFRAKAMDAMMDDDQDGVSAYSAAASAILNGYHKQQEIELKQTAEKRKDEELRLAREKFEAAEKRLSAVQDAIDKAKDGRIDPAKVADEIDKILGRKK